MAVKDSDPSDDLVEVMEQVLSSLSKLPGVIGHLGDIIEQFAQGMNPLIIALGELIALMEVSNTAGGSGGSSGKGESGAGDVSGMAKFAKVAAVAAAALAAVTVAINLLEQQFQKMIGFVRLFNPGVINLFQTAMDNLGATIGQAFVPVIQVATEVVRQWTSMLAPIMSQLVPIVREVSTVFGNILLRVLNSLANVIRASLPGLQRMMEVVGLIVETMMPFITVMSSLIRVVTLVTRVILELSGFTIWVRILTKAAEALSIVFRILEEAVSIVEVVVNTLIDGMIAFISSFLPGKDAMDALNKAVQWVIRNMYVLAVQMARFVGALGIADALIKHVEGKLDPGAVAAQQPQIKTLDQIAKDLALAAAAAGGAAGPGGIRDEKEFWARTLEEMKMARQNGVSVVDVLIQIRDAILRMIPGMGGGNVGSPPPGGAASGPGGLDVEGGIRGGVTGAGVGGVVLGPLGWLPGAIIGGAIGSKK